LSGEKTKLDMVFKSNWEARDKDPSREQFQKETEDMWNKFAIALERDYNLGKKASVIES
jgi:hypothetical protein